MKESRLQSQVVITNKNQEVIVRQKGSFPLRGGFSAVGRLTNNNCSKRRKLMQQADVFDLLDKVSKGAFSVFNNLKFNRSEVNNTTKFVPTQDMTLTEKESLSRRLRELKNVGLIVSVKKMIPGNDDPTRPYVFKDPRSTFIINPGMIRCTNHDESEYLWLQCGGKGEAA